MRSILQKIAEEYLTEKNNKFKGNQLANFVRNITTQTIIEEQNLSNKYKVTGSVGQGNWANIPWIAVFDTDITTSATKGYYIVYLFSRKMKKVYLSLNQGYTYYEEKYKGKKGEKVKKNEISKKRNEAIKSVVNKYRTVLADELSDFNSLEIKLLDEVIEENGIVVESYKPSSIDRLGLGYELTHICGKEYDLNNLPSDTELIEDLRRLIDAYMKLKISVRSLGARGLSNQEQLNNTLDTFVELNKKSIDEDEDKEYLKIMKEETEALRDDVPKSKDRMGNYSVSKAHRSAKVAANALADARYTCEFDQDHQHFISRRNAKNYVEAHHLIPMKYQEEYVYSLDVEANVISLCPVCHRILHHGERQDIDQILTKLYEDRRTRLELCNLNISLDDLKDKY